MFFISNTLLCLQFAYIVNKGSLVLTRNEILSVAITIDNFPTASSLDFYTVCSTTILVLIAFYCERFAKTIVRFFSIFKENTNISTFCLLKKTQYAEARCYPKKKVTSF